MTTDPIAIPPKDADAAKQTDWQISNIWTKLKQHGDDLDTLAKEQLALIAKVDLLLQRLDPPEPKREADLISEAQIGLIGKLIRKHKPDGTQYADLAEFEAAMSDKHGRPFKVAELTKAQGAKLIESLVTRVGELHQAEKKEKDMEAPDNSAEDFWRDASETFGIEQP